MPLDSIEYWGYLALIYALFLACPARGRWILLLLASLAFHAAFRTPLSLAAFAILVIANFQLAQWLQQTERPARRGAIFWSGVVINLGVLASSRFAGFAVARGAGAAGGTAADAVATIGVSYAVLTTLSYLTDVFARGRAPERHLGLFALHVWFFPKLVQGPIERADLIAELRKEHPFDYDRTRAALLIIAGGLFKKLVVANRLGLYVDHVYDDVHTYAGLDLIAATYLYAFQVYFDFSGYTDIAIGSARLFGIPLTPNFNSPYFARSIAEFWRRWHISFSRWILDYIFRPLQLQWRHLKTAGTAAALLVTFLLSGLWHGVTWPFVVWGLLHGTYLGASLYYRPVQAKLYARLGIQKARWLPLWQIAVTFNLVSLAWIFFRARNIADAWYVVTHLFAGGLHVPALLRYRPTQLMILIAAGSVLAVVPLLNTRREEAAAYLSSRPLVLRWAVYYAILVAIILLGVRPHAPFLYARF